MLAYSLAPGIPLFVVLIFFLAKKTRNKIFHMKIFIRFVKSTMVFFYALKMNINVGVILGSSSGFCASSVNYVILCKLFRVRLNVGLNWRTRPGLFLNLIRSFRTAGSAPPRAMQAHVCLVAVTDHVDYSIVTALICKPRTSVIYFSLHSSHHCLELQQNILKCPNYFIRALNTYHM